MAKDAGVTLTKDDISIAHRINTKDDTTNSNANNSRGGAKKIPSIIARIKSRKLRNKLFLARRTLHEHNTPTHTGARIYDDVTPLRSRILYALRNRKVDNTEVKMFKFVWSNEGRIFARTEAQTNQTTVNPVTGRDVWPKYIINKVQDLGKLGWQESEILDIIKDKRD